MKFLLLVIDLIMYAICIVHTYFDLISVPLSYLNFSHLSFLMKVWVFIQQLRHMWGAIYFRTVKFWERISDFLINCVYINFAHGLYSIGALPYGIYQTTFQGGEHGFWATLILFWEN